MTETKNKRKNKKGFTLIEILFIVAIIAILVGIILINMVFAKDKAQGNSAFTSFKETATASYMCLLNGGSGSSLNRPASAGNNPICNNGSMAEGLWPNMDRSAWDYGDFCWCNPSSSSATFPTSCQPGAVYQNRVMGGDNATGEFCYGIIRDGDKHMWCTVRGCYKDF